MPIICVLQDDPALARRLIPAELPCASRRALAPVVSLPKGIFWPHERLPSGGDQLGMLLLEGMLLCASAVTDRPTVEVLGPGDVFRPFDAGDDRDATVFGERRWWALRPARIAVLDAGFTRAMCDHPAVIAELAARLARRSAASSLRLALAAEPRLSTRLHDVMWQLARRFGQSEADGILLQVPLCHALLSWLAGARRPAVSRAVNELERTGLMAQRPDGTWWLARRQAVCLDQPVAA